MNPSFSRFDHKCVKQANQNDQKYRPKTSSQDAPEFKKIAARILSQTYYALLGHLLFLSRPGGMRAALGIRPPPRSLPERAAWGVWDHSAVFSDLLILFAGPLAALHLSADF